MRVEAVVAGVVPDPAPSAVVAISINGEPVFTRGFGSVGEGPPTEHTGYRVGSLTKQITAAAVMTLVDRQAPVPVTGEKFTFDTLVRDILPGVDEWGDLTVRDLLTHRSGIPNFTADVPPDLDPLAAIEAPRMLAAFKEYPRETEKTFAYSNTNYFLLAQIVEAVTATGDSPASFRNYVREYVLTPAGMVESGFIGEEPPGVPLAPLNLTGPARFGQPDWPKGAGDFVTTAADFQRWNAAYFAGRVVSPDSLAEALSPQIETPEPEGGAYGFAWYILPTATGVQLYHRGAIGGGSAINAVIRRSDGNWVAISILTNAGAASQKLTPIADALLTLVLE
jgi:CubicO group peptidase (beta-lactamase class C family)